MPDANNLIKAMQVLGQTGSQSLMTGATIETLFQAFQSVAKLDDVPGLMKATYNQSGSAISGLTAYDLEGPAKLFYPVLTPLRNETPRVSGKGGIQANWRAITGINTTQISAGVSEGNRGGSIVVSTKDYLAAYKGIGFESSASFEAQYAGETFDDVRMRAQQAGLHSLMLAEERVLLGGVGSYGSGITNTPSLSQSSLGGALSNSTVSVIVVALTQDGYFRNASAVGGTGLNQTYIRTNGDGTTDTVNGGVAQKSAAQPITLTGGTSTQSITAVVTPKAGNAAYAWYWGTAGNETLGAITTVPRYVITAAATGSQLASALTANDYSQDSLVFDGLITQAMAANSGSYWTDLGGLALTSDGVGGAVEIDAVLKSQWDTYRLNPEVMWVSSQEAKSLRKIVLAGSVNGALRFNIDAKQGMLMGGMAVATYLNEYGLNGATEVQIRQHPYITPGTILFTQKTLPYPMNDTPNVYQVRTRQDYYSIEWPWRRRQYEYGVYADEVLQVYFPPAISILTGIAPS